MTLQQVRVVERSTTGADAVDGLDLERWGTGVDQPAENHHPAKVRVAGSNPVFRSEKVPRQGRISVDPA